MNLLTNFYQPLFQIFKVVMQPFGINVFNGSVAQLGLQFSDKPVSVVDIAMAGAARYAPQGIFCRTDREVDAARKGPVENEKTQDVVGIDF